MAEKVLKMCFPMERAVELKFESAGLQCIITRADIPQIGEKSWTAHRCGYVRIPAGHPWNPGPKTTDNEIHDDVPGLPKMPETLKQKLREIDHRYDALPVDVHGGLTFGKIEECVHEDGVGYWIGFDCHHSGDAGLPEGDPRIEEFNNKIGMVSSLNEGHYWTLEEVKLETEMLAHQVAMNRKSKTAGEP